MDIPNIQDQDITSDENNLTGDKTVEENSLDPKNDQERVEVNETSINVDEETEETKSKLTKLPVGRIRTIIKSDPDINLINQEAVFLITKAAEYFIMSLARESYKYTQQSKKKTVQKQDIQSAVDGVNALMFLDGI